MARSQSGAQRPMVDMKTHILTVASDIMLEKGINNTSLKDIAKEAGISKGTLYYYYSAKEDIIYDIADANMKHITDELLAGMEHRDEHTDPKEILKALYDRILEADTRGRLHLYLLNEAVTSNEKLAEKFQKLYSDWRSMLRDAIAQLFSKGDAETNALTYLILSSLDGLMIQKMCAADEIPVQDIVNLFFQ